MRFLKKVDLIKNDILGEHYSLSVAFLTKQKSREINKKYRNKDKATNVLSFALRENMGELLLCKPVIKEEAKTLNKKFQTWLGFLAIHGMLHLKGLPHGKKMERLEKKYSSRTKF